MTIPGITSHLPRLDADIGEETRGPREPRVSRNVPDSGGAASELRPSKLSRGGSTGAANAKADAPKSIEQAAEEFEALLVAQMLKTFRESGSGGWLGSGGGSAGATMELAEVQLAKVLAQGGALGIKQQVMKDLAQAPSRNSAAEDDGGSVDGVQARTRLRSASEATGSASALDEGTTP